jgi:hypothetical protein
MRPDRTKGIFPPTALGELRIPPSQGHSHHHRIDNIARGLAGNACVIDSTAMCIPASQKTI